MDAQAQSTHAELLFDGACGFSLRAAVSDVTALIPFLFPFGEGKLHLRYAAAVEIHAQRDERVTFLMHLADQTPNFFAVQEQLARPRRLVIPAVSEFIRADVHVVEPHFAIFYASEAVANVGCGGTQGLHFSAREHNARFEGLMNMVVVACFAVGRYQAILVLTHSVSPPPTGVSMDKLERDPGCITGVQSFHSQFQIYRLAHCNNDRQEKEDRRNDSRKPLQRSIEASCLIEEHLGSATDGSQTFSFALLEQNHNHESNGYDKLQNVQQRVQGAIAPPLRVKRTPLLYHSCRALTMNIRPSTAYDYAKL